MPLTSEFHLAFSIVPVALSVLGIMLAMLFYKKESQLPARISNSMGGLYRAASKKFYIDECYLFITRSFLYGIIAKGADWFDKKIVDRLVTGTGDAKIGRAHV